MRVVRSRISVGLLESFAELFCAAQFLVVCAQDWLLFKSHRAAAGVRRAEMLVLHSRRVLPEILRPIFAAGPPTGRGWRAGFAAAWLVARANSNRYECRAFGTRQHSEKGRSGFEFLS